MIRYLLPVAGVMFLAFSNVEGSTYRGPHFVEPDDAGSSRDTAQDVKTENGGAVQSMSGALTGSGGFRDVFGDFQDVYRINIADPGSFKIELQDSSFGIPDAMMFLFNESGNPIMASDNTSSENFNPILHNNEGQFFDQAGIYYLAITSAPSEAMFELGTDNFIPLFNLAENPFGTVGPAQGTEKFKWEDAWSPPTNPSNFGSYILNLDGVISIPGPGGLAMLAIAGLACRRRRRS